MPQLQWNRNAGQRVRAHTGSQALTAYSRRRHTAKYSIQAPYVFDKIIRLSKAKHGPMQITTVDDESTHRDARIRMQTVYSVAGGQRCQNHATEWDVIMYTGHKTLETDTAARTEGQNTRTGAFGLPSTHTLEPSVAHGKVEHPRSSKHRVHSTQRHPFVQ